MATKKNVWKYTPNKNDSNGVIELFYESQDANVLNMPDNIVISPHGNIILCEDAKGRDRLVCIKSNGRVSYIGSNAFNNAEFAGLTSKEAAPEDCCPVSLEIADPVAVYILIVESSILGLVTKFTEGIPLSTVKRVEALVEVAALKG